ncbi:MAG: hypothetical protein R8K20_07170, partial [Gallionellaceae bacterium]
MTDYVKSISFTGKRGTTPADPAIFDTEFGLVATASATKANKTGGTFSGPIIVPAAAAIGETTKAIQAQDVKHYSFPTGTKMTFFQASAPIGWTQDNTNNDAMLRIVSGTGGGISGTHGASLGVPATTTGSHALIISEMPAHTHTGAIRVAN